MVPVCFLVSWHVLLVCRLGNLCTLRSHFGNLPLRVAPQYRLHDVLDHVTKTFIRDKTLAHCFPPCTTKQKEREFREYATMQLRYDYLVVTLDRSACCDACLNRPLRTRWYRIQCHHQVWTVFLIVLNTSTCFNTFCWAFQTGSYCGQLRRLTLTLTVTSERKVRWVGFFEQ
jgi:hypothetical protein